MGNLINDSVPLVVAIGVILDTSQRVLMAKRSEKSLMAGFWEFPGGKVEPGECVFQALQRELREELGIEVNAARPWCLLEATGHASGVGMLHFWCVTAFQGNACGAEGQLVEWVPCARLKDLSYLPANAPIVEALVECNGALPF